MVKKEREKRVKKGYYKWGEFDEIYMNVCKYHNENDLSFVFSPFADL
jgi:hypothetical protein